MDGTTVVVGVGNRLKGDDAAGPAVVDLLAAQRTVACIDAGVAPENHLEKIVALKPDTVLLVDAVHFGGKPGEARLFEAEQIGPGGLSTHGLSLQMTCEYLGARRPVRIFLLGIQAGSADLGQGLSPPVERATREIARAIADTQTDA